MIVAEWPLAISSFHVHSFSIHGLSLDVNIWIVLIIGAHTNVKFSSLKTKPMLTSTEKQESSLKGTTSSAATTLRKMLSFNPSHLVSKNIDYGRALKEKQHMRNINIPSRCQKAKHRSNHQCKNRDAKKKMVHWNLRGHSSPLHPSSPEKSSATC